MSAIPVGAAQQRPNSNSLADKASALFDILRKNTVETENARRVHEDNVRAIHDAGLFRLSSPKRFGGEEATLRETLGVTSEIARACGSTGWVSALINVCSWLVSLYPEQTQQEVFGSSADTRIAGVIAPKASTEKTDGGYVITGSWPWASGSLHASWVLVGFPMVDDAGKQVDQGLALIPSSDITIKDTWFSIGMRGTGSNTIVADKAFVPNHRVLSLSKAIEGKYLTPYSDTEPLYRSAFCPVLATVLVGPVLGLARAALDVFTERLPGRGIQYTWYEKQSEAAVTHLQIAEAAMKIDTAHLHAYRAADDIDRAAAAGMYPDHAARARIRMDCGYAVNAAKEAVNLLFSATGGSAAAEFNHLQRVWRDVNTASLHGILAYTTNLELYGRSLLQLEPNTPLI
ncbi:acyl-CoA dehydrogenase family protein [Burkholderia multivorans]|uniref:Acyl-CoA dehydrogenase family protein n=1 Tax=Burkholderia multivorans TaxID=87883 RepID=A0AAP2HRY2_9BURK|nr:acyl-CoA dehydrogenase family protein [Burkholderia multivorans]MBU9360747.1 acyl-CoA dehydrogenase family protein [Burkholderia multivorans]MBU9366680.1 acyl-CoA dehydrogenase family protein [Burkholderia multivorans]MBU9598346.1 acyl-CoA dehydrogenase family protein [Burkholderia multivorans]MCA8485868.1 acyl-CoA dehydrogenase family protein [Burkholderia multivorans]